MSFSLFNVNENFHIEAIRHIKQTYHAAKANNSDLQRVHTEIFDQGLSEEFRKKEVPLLYSCLRSMENENECYSKSF